MSKLSKLIFAAKAKHLALLEKRDDVKIREAAELEKQAEVAVPECNNHAGVAPAIIY